MLNLNSRLHVQLGFNSFFQPGGRAAPLFHELQCKMPLHDILMSTSYMRLNNEYLLLMLFEIISLRLELFGVLSKVW